MPRALPGRYQVLYSVGALVAVGGLIFGAATAQQIVNGSGSGSAATSTVRLGLNPQTRTCDYEMLAPGDLTGSATCVVSVTYTGSIGAFVSLTVRIRSKAGSGGSPLYDGTNMSGLTFSVSDGHHSYTVPTGPGVPCEHGFTCWAANNDLAAAYRGSVPALVFDRSDEATFTMRPRLLTAVGNAYQGGTALIVLHVQAVQAPANPLPPNCDITTIGQPCPASGTFTWS